MDTGDRGSLKFAHGAENIQFVAVAGVGIGNHREIDSGRNAPSVADHLRHRQQAEIGIAKRRGGPGAGHVDRLKTGLSDQFRGDAVIGAGGGDHAVLVQQFTEAARLGHAYLQRIARNKLWPRSRRSSSLVT